MQEPRAAGSVELEAFNNSTLFDYCQAVLLPVTLELLILDMEDEAETDDEDGEQGIREAAEAQHPDDPAAALCAAHEGAAQSLGTVGWITKALYVARSYLLSKSLTSADRSMRSIYNQVQHERAERGSSSDEEAGRRRRSKLRQQIL